MGRIVTNVSIKNLIDTKFSITFDALPEGCGSWRFLSDGA